MDTMNAYGAMYDVVQLNDENQYPTDFNFTLYDESGNGKYNSIVLTDASLANFNPETSTWSNGLDAEQKLYLDEYRKKFNVRMVVISSFPGMAYPALVAPTDGSQPYTCGFGTAKFYTQQEAHPSLNMSNLLSNVRAESKLMIRKEHPYMNEGVRYHWYRPILDQALNQNGEFVKPFMKICPRETETGKRDEYNDAINITNVDDDDTNCTIGAFIMKTPIGEEMHFLHSSNPYNIFGSVLADVWYPWVTKGIFVGKRRLLLSTQVDDYFLSTGLYNTTLNRQYDSQEDGSRIPPFRITGDDISKLSQYQSNLVDNVLPPGSNFTIEHAFNGKGFNNKLVNTYFKSLRNANANANGNGSASANTITNNTSSLLSFEDSDLSQLEFAILKYRDNFRWVSHTFDHIDMYCVNSKCPALDTSNDTCLVTDLSTNPQRQDYETQWLLQRDVPKSMSQLSCFSMDYNYSCNYDLINVDYTGEPVYPASGYTPYEFIVYELSKNQWFTNNYLYYDKTKDELLDNDNNDNNNNNINTFSHYSMVNPWISGLNYTVALKAMLAKGYRSAVGDSSRPDLQPDNLHHMFEAKPKVGENGVLFDYTDPVKYNAFLQESNGDSVKIISRYPTRIYFDCSTPLETFTEHGEFLFYFIFFKKKKWLFFCFYVVVFMLLFLCAYVIL